MSREERKKVYKEGYEQGRFDEGGKRWVDLSLEV